MTPTEMATDLQIPHGTIWHTFIAPHFAISKRHRAGAPAGVVCAFAEPRGWCAGVVLDVAGCAVCTSAAPSSWRAGGCAGCCRGCLNVFAVHTPPSSGRSQPASLRFHVREAQVPCSSTRCPGRPPPTLPHSVGHACAGRVPCWYPLCDIPSACCSFTGPWTVTRSSLRMLRRVAAFCRPLRPVLLLVSFPRSRIPLVGVLGLC